MTRRRLNFRIFSRANQHGKRWYFHATGRNGEVVLASEGYHRHGSCLDTVWLIRNHAGESEVDDSEYDQSRKRIIGARGGHHK